MTTIFNILGLVMSVLICAAVALHIAEIFKDLLDRQALRLHQEGKDAGMDQARRILDDAAYWYSEHPPTMELLRDILRDGNWDCREKWRAAMAELSTGKQDKAACVIDRNLARHIAVDFFYWWHNRPGSNTEQGFDEWWEKETANIHRFVGVERTPELDWEEFTEPDGTKYVRATSPYHDEGSIFWWRLREGVNCWYENHDAELLTAPLGTWPTLEAAKAAIAVKHAEILKTEAEESAAPAETTRFICNADCGPYFLDSAIYAKAAEDEVMMPSFFDVWNQEGQHAA